MVKVVKNSDKIKTKFFFRYDHVQEQIIKIDGIVRNSAEVEAKIDGNTVILIRLCISRLFKSFSHEIDQLNRDENEFGKISSCLHKKFYFKFKISWAPLLQSFQWQLAMKITWSNDPNYFILM